MTDLLCPSWLLPGSGLSAGATQQGQETLELASMGGGGVELEGKSASIQSISECIHFSNASSFSSCYGFAGLRLRSLLRELDLHLDDGIAPAVEHPQKRAERRER